MICYIIRHAEKEQGDFYNHRLRHQDEPISQNGRLKAQKLASYFASRPISTIYVSGYQRTQQTIENITQQLHLTAILDERLSEIDNGLFEGLSEQVIFDFQRAKPEKRSNAASWIFWSKDEDNTSASRSSWSVMMDASEL